MAAKKLEARLATIMAVLEALACERVHDLACDHGLVGAAYASAFPNRQVYLSDIANQPLDRAKTLLRQLNLANTHCFLSDGLSEHQDIEAYDAVVLAGLSGESIWRIFKQDKRIAACKYQDRLPLFIVAQPMQLAAKFKLAAYLHDFAILHESLVLDKGRVQEIILLVNQPYYALNLKSGLCTKLCDLANQLGQVSLFARKEILTYLQTWQKYLRASISLPLNWQTNDVQLVLDTIATLYGKYACATDVNTIQPSSINLTLQTKEAWQTLLALTVCGLGALVSYGEKICSKIMPTVVNYADLKARKGTLLEAAISNHEARYLSNLLQYYQHKLPHLQTKVLHAPASERAFWQAVLASLGF